MSKRSIVTLFIVVVSLLIVLVLPAVAHEEREVGDFVIEFGWRSEPALAGEINGPEFFIHLLNADGSEGDAIEDGSFQVLITFGDQATTLDLLPVEGDPGHYVAAIIPTLPGDYTFEVTGEVNGTLIDETFTSADGFFDSVSPASDVQFPAVVPSNAELLQMIQALQAQLDELRAASGTVSSGG